jgi:transposase InsO family protein
MSRPGNPYDNAQCESFMKTLKYEEVYRNEYRDLTEARAQIGVFLERSTTKNVCTRRWATFLRPSSRPNWQRKMWRRLRRSLLHEFSEASAIYPSDVETTNREQA